MKKIYVLLAMLLSLTFSLEIVASNNQVTSRSSGFTSINGKGVATFVVKSPVAQSCDLSFLMMPGEYEDGSFTSVALKVNGVTLPNPISFNTYGWQPANTTGNAVTLNEGDNTIQFISGRDDVPIVNDIKIWDENNSYNLIPNMSISQTSTTINTEMQNSTSVPDTIIGSMINPIKYGFLKTKPYTYTTYIPLSISDRTVLTLYAPSENDPLFGFYHSNVEFNAYLFKFHENDSISYSESIQTHNKSFYWQDSIPPGNYYILLEALNETGYVTLRVNSIMYKCYAGGVSADFSCIPTQSPTENGFYSNFFTTNIISRNIDIIPNPILWLKKKVADNKYVIIATNDNNKIPSDCDWGLNARIRYFFTDSMVQASPDYSLLLSSYNPMSIDSIEYCDLYYDKLSYGDYMFKNMKDEDFMFSDGGIHYDNSYNCFAWSAGTNMMQLNPNNVNEGNILWFDSLYNNEVVCTNQGFFQRDINSTRFTRSEADETNAVIALWGSPEPDGRFIIRHASIKDNIYDTIPHGYSWESKDGVYARFFHPMYGVQDTEELILYGRLRALYRPITNSNSVNVVEKRKVEQNNSYETIDLSDDDLEVISYNISCVPLSQLNKFEIIYENLRTYAKGIHNLSNIWRLKDSNQYKNLLSCMQEINNGEYLAFDKFVKGDIFAMLLIEDYAKSTPTTKDEWNKIFYNKDIMHIKRTQRSKVNLFIKNMLLIKNAYSVTNNAKSELNELFNVVVSSNTISINIEIEEISTYSIKVVDLSNNYIQTIAPEITVQEGKYEHTINLQRGNYVIVCYLNGGIYSKKIIEK